MKNHHFGRTIRTEGAVEATSVDLSSVSYDPIGQHRHRHQDGTFLSFFDVFCGRGKEKLALVKAFQKCRTSNTNNNPVVFVRGQSGVGKTALVRNTLRDLVSRTGGYFVEGKWEQQIQSTTKIGEPYAALVAALSDLCDLICQDGVPEKTRAALAPGTEGHLLSVLLPRDEIFGRRRQRRQEDVKSSSLETMNTMASSTRFHHAFREFLNVVGSREHPIVLFLDDVQWTGEGSIDLMKRLADPDRQSPNVLLIMAYREDDVDTWRALSIVGQKEQEDHTDNVLQVGNLDESTVNQMLSMVLHSDPSRTRELARLILAKTHGNALFVKQFLVMLMDSNRIRFDFDDETKVGEQRWKWDIDEIQRTTDVTENVADLIEQNFHGILSKHERAVLEKASFLGNKIDVALLTNVVATLEQEQKVADGEEGINNTADRGSKGDFVASCLLKARKEGFIENVDEYTYKFSHDRIQQCLYDAVDGEADRARIHAKIGNLLLDYRKSREERRNDTVFVVADHMNHGLSAHHVHHLKRLAEVNLEAANESISKSDFHSALHYAERGIEGLQAIPSGISEWDEDNYEVRLGLGDAACHASLSLCLVDRCERHANEVITNSRTLKDRLSSMEHLVLVNGGGRNNLSRGIEVGRIVLKGLGCRVPSKSPSPLSLLMQIVRIRRMLGKLGEEGFLGMPLMKDQQAIVACRVYGFVGLYATAASAKDLAPMCFLRSLQLSLENGFSPIATPTSLAMYALVEKMLDNSNRAIKLAELALTVQVSRGHPSGQARTLSISHSLLLHWRRPVRETVEPHRVAFCSGLRHGDLEFGVMALAGYCAAKYRAAANLKTLSAEVKDMHDMILRDYNQVHTLLWTYPYLQVLYVLMGETEDPTKLSGDVMIEEDYLRTADDCGNPQLAPLVYALKIDLAVFFESCVAMEFALERFSRTLTKEFTHLSVNSCFTHCLRGLASLQLYSKTTRRKYWSLFMKSIRTLKKVDSCTAKPMCLLLLAEKDCYHALGHKSKSDDETFALFEKAIQSAHGSGLTQLAALATERAATYTVERHAKRRVLKDAKKLYGDWGAHAKVESLQRKRQLLFDGEEEESE